MKKRRMSPPLALLSALTVTLIVGGLILMIYALWLISPVLGLFVLGGCLFAAGCLLDCVLPFLPPQKKDGDKP